MRDDIEHNNKQQKECIAIMFDTRSCVVFIMSLSILEIHMKVIEQELKKSRITTAATAALSQI